MAHAIWNGAINFGLVTIPVKLFSAVRADEGIHFHLLHDKDEGRIHNVRKCEVCGHEVPWEHVEKGWEYEKGAYVVAKEEELKKMRPAVTQSIDIVEFVDASEIDSMLYDTPYYIEPEKRGQHAYALLREALSASGKVGVAKVVLRTREHLAALKPSDKALVLELMHFDHEIVAPSQFELPAHTKMPESEMKMAKMLIDSMTTGFRAADFKDKYQAELRAMLEARAAHQPVAREHGAKAPPPTNVIDLLDVLQKSLAATQQHRSRKAAGPAHQATPPATKRSRATKAPASRAPRARSAS
jgi:DNA end-binding protein Ku